MLQNITREFIEIPAATQHPPCISLTLAFEPKMTSKDILINKFKAILFKIEHELTELFSDDISMPILMKLHRLVKELNYHTHTKSIAIFVSPYMERVYYLEMQVSEYVSLDNSFEIRDLIYSKEQDHEYIVIVLGDEWSKIYRGNTNQFSLTILNMPQMPRLSETDAGLDCGLPEGDRTPAELLRETDNGLGLLMLSKRPPLFVIGSEPKMKQFREISHSAPYVLEYIPEDVSDITRETLQKIMISKVANWKKVRQHNLHKKVEEAVRLDKIFIGINDVWNAATQRKGHLLILENGYRVTRRRNPVEFSNLRYNDARNNCFYVKDTVDEVIEKVLANGGNVEFVDRGLLKSYQKIVLIKQDKPRIIQATIPFINGKLL